ncbi:MAG: electron transfer flavoprotein subunit alpha/FixB family protein [Coriobacteriales bacterium]|jgi:electron transfer flavoprotein alpha subunit
MEDFSNYSGVMTYAEQRDGELLGVALELLGEGRRLADELGVELSTLLIGHNVEGLAQTLIEHGADRVYLADDPVFEQYRNDPYAKVFYETIEDFLPEIVLVGATHNGRDLAPSVAAMLETGLTADCTALSINDDHNLVQTRPAFGGNLMAEILTANHRPQMATVRPGVMDKAKADPDHKGEVVKLNVNVSPDEIRAKIISQSRDVASKVALTDADVIVAGGMGLGSADGFELLQKLADEFSNSTIAASRACVDAGWIDHSYQVGQTGATVKPNIYFACGISGMIQHVSGMKESKRIVAINNNPEADIFDIADYGIVGDLYEVIPVLIDEIEKQKAAAEQ